MVGVFRGVNYCIFLCRFEFHGNILRINQQRTKNSIQKRENDVSIVKQQNNG